MLLKIFDPVSDVVDVVQPLVFRKIRPLPVDHAILEEGLDDFHGFLLVLRDANIFHDIVVSFPLRRVEL